MKKIGELEPLDILLRSTLYQEFAFDDGVEGCEKLFRILLFSGKFDWLCPDCRKETTYEGVPNYPANPKNTSLFAIGKLSYFKVFSEHHDLGYFYTQQNFCVPIRCLRGEPYAREHRVEVWFKVEKNRLIKVGQFPSATTIEQFESAKYQKVLGRKYGEFNRAIGLFNFNVGIGSFVYLRRIFEELINEAAHKHPALLSADFESSRMDEKILALKKVLPTYLVEKRKLYSVLSKGVHQLSEEKCLEYFPVVRLGIELMLDEKVERLDRADKIKSNSRHIDEMIKALEKE
jgi:hypothetical protein